MVRVTRKLAIYIAMQLYEKACKEEMLHKLELLISEL